MWVKEFIDHTFMASRCFKTRRPINPTVLEDQELQSLKVPTLYVVGENEKIYSAQKAVQRLNQVAPHIKTETIPNASHDLTFYKRR
jgi:pimeloyl-ACP methyl ester carboxylesterase